MFTLFRRFSSWFKQDPTKAVFSLTVIGAHAFFVCALFIFPAFHSLKRPNQKLIVKTIHTQPKTLSPGKKPAAIASAPKAQKTPASPKKNPAPISQTPPAAPKKTTAPPAKKKETAAASKTPTKKKELPSPAKKPTAKAENAPSMSVPQELLQELEERIAKIETKRDKLYQRGSTSIPKNREPLPEEEEITSSFSYDAGEEFKDYADFLVDYLHQNLHLPEFGEVKIQITLKKDGSVEKLVVLKTESEKNKKYLEESLPRLHFPEFKGLISSKKQQTFVLTFCNEI